MGLKHIWSRIKNRFRFHREFHRVVRKSGVNKFFIVYLLQVIIRKFLVNYQHRRLNLFNSTNIETYAYCNRRCSFCFNNERFPKRDLGVMGWSTWKKIIDELSNIRFAGRISPHFYGEPLLDKRLPKLISYARKRCPYSYIMFDSNGDFLTEELLLELIKNGLDRIAITNYDNFEKSVLVGLSRKYFTHVSYIGYRDMHLVNRAGMIFDEKKHSFVNKPCLRPSTQLVINWKGNVLLCCNDYYEKHIFGNVKDKPILEIWNSEKFKRYRELLRKGYREKIDICKDCDNP